LTFEVTNPIIVKTYMSELVDVSKKYDFKFTPEEANWRADLVRQHRRLLKEGQAFGQPLNPDSLRKVQVGEINNHRILTILKKRGVNPTK